MENAENIFSSLRYAEVRIDLAKNFPFTVYGDSSTGRRSRKLLLADVISAEDLPLLVNQIEAVLAGKQNMLQTHARIKTDGEYTFFLIMCALKKEKFGKAHLDGFIFGVSDYLEFAGEDRVLLEYKRKDKVKVDLINNSELTLTDIIDKSYLTQIQAPLAAAGIKSAIVDKDGNLICSPNEPDAGDKPAPNKKLHFKKIDIRITGVIAAQWVIAAKELDLIENNAPLHEALAQAISRIANSFVMLYNEMQNTEHSNKLLSQHIEQQILTNNVYNIILERENASEALGEVIKLVGEYMQMRRIRVYVDDAPNRCFEMQYEWQSASCPDTRPPVMPYADVQKIMERLEYSDMYIPAVVSEQDGFAPEACTIANLTADGNRFGVMVFAPAKPGYIPTAQESKVLRSVSQITATLMLRKQADEKLHYHAFFDQILDIPNRAKLDEDLEAELAANRRGAAAVVKIVNLHTFNELFGHTYTDGLLRKAAQFIAEMPAPGLTAYRFSGNTLMLVLREAGEDAVKAVTEKLLKRFAKPWKHENSEHYLEAGIGIALYPNGFHTLDSIYRAADLALYKATEYSANSCAFYKEEFKAEADENYSLEQKLRAATSDGMNGFSVKYQPVFAAESNTVIAFYEAFVSWNGLPTQKLITLAENMGLDIVIDSWVLGNACAFCKKMQEYEPGFSVSVNITPWELRSGSVVAMVAQALHESGLAGNLLSLEIPERAFSDRQDGVPAVLKKLRGLGVRLIIDSYGTDYGGLRLLKHSLMDMVKMDFSLFTNIFGEFDEIWVGAAAKLASTLKNGICVKRVEERGQLEQAEKFGVKYAQGYLFAKPETEEEILKKVQKAVKLK
ncbi:MAG: EAL domain-containing protein [Oscillospiraceae bacterium]|nr:EAL domain-containing protein [Oscillospiraceae bacterium]